jgi:hypothetical protein
VEKGNKFKDLQLRVFSEVQGCCMRTCRQCSRKFEIFASQELQIDQRKKLKHFIESIQPLLESLKPLEKLGSGIKIEEKHIVQMLK